MGKKAEKNKYLQYILTASKQEQRNSHNNSMKETRCKTICLIIQFLEAHVRFLILK